ncbi:MAG TPA: caspase family protein [Saprospiraceae bacterium]|nr:caspase family protein [Saprospiraceae bacterium]
MPVKGIVDSDLQPGINNAKKRTNHLLLIAIDNYQNGFPKLNNCKRDALLFKDTLLGFYQFLPENCIEIFDENATEKNILKTFDILYDRLTTDDNLVIYFSGHGEFHKSAKRGYWIPVDAEPGERSGYMNNVEVRDFIENISAQHVFAIVDSCFSGALFRSGISQEELAAQRQENLPSRWLLTAGRIEPVSDGSLGQNSPFATSLITFLRAAEMQYLWASDICTHVTRTVSFNSEQTPKGEPLPVSAHQGGQFIFRKKAFFEKVEIIPERPIEVTPVIKSSTPERRAAGSLEDWKIYTKELVAEAMDRAFIKLNEDFNRASSKYNDLILLRGRFNGLQANQMRGVVSESQGNLQMNQIRYALLDLIDSMEERDLRQMPV